MIQFCITRDHLHAKEKCINITDFISAYVRHFLYSHPAQPLGPEDLVWRMMAGKLINIKLHTRRSQRVVNESRSICTCDCRRPNMTSPLTP
nr:probable arabinosyltransferase ARAD1 [Tanacetum cinerariifolium]